MTAMTQSGSTAHADGVDKRKVFFLLIKAVISIIVYTQEAGAKVHDLMVDLIDRYFRKHLDVSHEEAERLHQDYYKNYGLAIEGLVRHHKIDPIEYNSQVDDALPLEDIIKPRQDLKKLLADVDRTKFRLWLFTNAYVTHGRRVVRLLEVENEFEGLTYCNYESVPFLCKPQDGMFRKAMREAGVENPDDCYFVDDSFINCEKAESIGWHTAHLVEEDVKPPEKQASKFQIKHLDELRTIFPEVFKPAETSS